MSKAKFSPRHKARRLALQALYQWSFTHESPSKIIEAFQSSEHYTKLNESLFCDLVKGVIQSQPELDQIIGSQIHCELSELTPIELAVLRVAVYELIHHLDVPYRVVINEALELTKTFGTEEGYRFVNGVLDQLAHRYREHESEGHRSS